MEAISFFKHMAMASKNIFKEILYETELSYKYNLK